MFPIALQYICFKTFVSQYYLERRTRLSKWIGSNIITKNKSERTTSNGYGLTHLMWPDYRYHIIILHSMSCKKNTVHHTSYCIHCYSFTDDMGTESIGWSSVRHWCDDRLSDGSVSKVYQLLVVSRLENNAVPQQEIRDVGHGEKVPHPYATHHQGPEPIGFRKLQVHIQELARRNWGLHQTLRYLTTTHGLLL